MVQLSQLSSLLIINSVFVMMSLKLLFNRSVTLFGVDGEKGHKNTKNPTKPDLFGPTCVLSCSCCSVKVHTTTEQQTVSNKCNSCTRLHDFNG